MDKRLKRTNEVYKEQSRQRLEKIAVKKVQTTMIGALDSIENSFGFLWNHGEHDRSPEQEEMHAIFQNLREEILNKGNQQMRNLKTEISEYEVEWQRHSVTLKPMN